MIGQSDKKKSKLFSRFGRNRQSMGSEAGGITLLQSMSPTPEVDILDMEMFVNDPDKWFTKSVFNFHMALALQHIYQGYAAINPEIVLKHIEDGYWKDPFRQVPLDCGPQWPGYELSARLKAARDTKDNATLDTFLESLKHQVYWHCSKILQEETAELAGKSVLGYSSGSTNPDSDTTSALLLSRDTEKPTGTISDTENTSQSEITSSEDPDSTSATSTTSSASSSSGDTEEAVEIDTNTGSSAPSMVLPRAVSSTGDAPPPPAQTNNEERPLCEYTTILRMEAFRSGRSLQYIPSETMFEGRWPCEVIYDGTSRLGLAQSKKLAGHVAARMICQEIGITA